MTAGRRAGGGAAGVALEDEVGPAERNTVRGDAPTSGADRAGGEGLVDAPSNWTVVVCTTGRSDATRGGSSEVGACDDSATLCAAAAGTGTGRKAGGGTGLWGGSGRGAGAARFPGAVGGAEARVRRRGGEAAGPASSAARCTGRIVGPCEIGAPRPRRRAGRSIASVGVAVAAGLGSSVEGDGATTGSANDVGGGSWPTRGADSAPRSSRSAGAGTLVSGWSTSTVA
jgi:hypothetical protein